MQDQYYAEINWQDNTPISITYNDIYYSLNSGIKETNYVFIAHNNLLERFSKLKDNDVFIIGETGFGSGLNFLTTLQLWNKVVNTTAKLFFISFEKHPLNLNDLKQILNNFPELTSEVNMLIDQYNLILPAINRLYFNNNVFLDLVIGDINDSISNLEFKADAWFLDGFTPNKNESMWNQTVIKNISRLCKNGSTFATFTANSDVRRNLINHGFDVNKDKGFVKREMLFGTFKNNPPNTIITLKSRKSLKKPRPWFDKYTNLNPDKKVIVIGGGISGASTAYALAKRGYMVTLYEKNSSLAAEASGNYQAILYANFSNNYNPMQELSFSGYHYSHKLIKQLLPTNEYQECGLVKLAANLKEEQTQLQFLNSGIPPDFCYHVNHQQIESIAGIKVVNKDGIYFPYGLWFSPNCLINKLCEHPNIKVVTSTTINELDYVDNKWHIIVDKKIINSAINLVLCNAHAIDKLQVTRQLSLRKIRGQISIVPGNLGLKTIVCDKSYVAPNKGGFYTIGATFNFKDLHNDILIADHQENIKNATQIIPQIANSIDIISLSGQANLRTSSYDYMPIVGPIANYELFKKTYAKLTQDANYWLIDECPYYRGLFINVAHGAKGMLTAPISGEVIADYIDNTAFPISEKLRQALHPNRIYVRNLVKSTAC